MKRSIAVGWCAGLALGLITAPLSAQTTVQGAVVIQSGPVAGAISERRIRVIGPERQIVFVERISGRPGWKNKKHKYHAVLMYTDGRRFYWQPLGRAPLRRVVVYELKGRYYIDDDRWQQYRDRDYWDRGHGSRDDHDWGKGHDDRNDHGGRNDRDNGNHHDNGNHNGWDKH